MRKTKTSWLVILSVIASVLAVIACAVLLNWFADKPIVQIPRRYRELVLYCTTPIEIVMIISSLIISIKCVVSTAKTGGKGKTFGLIGIGTSMLLILVWLCLGLFVILFSGPYETPPTMNPNAHVVNEQSVTGSVVYQDPYSTPTPTCTPIPVPTLTPTPEPTSASTPAPDYYHPNFYVNPDNIPTVETVDDGVYFGELIGVSEDGTQARFRIGEPIGLTQECVESLEVGDALGVFDINGTELTITGVSDTSYGRRFQIDDDSLFFSNAYSGFTDSVLICSDGVNPVTINNVYVELPISSYCEIIDFYRTLDNDSNDPVYDDWQANEPSGVPLLDSFFWYYENHNSWISITLTDGWYNARSLAYPVVVNNGEVTGLYLEWR